MKLIQVILIGGLLAALGVYLRFLRSSLRDRLIAALFFTAAVAAVAIPGLTQRVANLVGVGRGTDLTFYLFALAFVFFAVLIYSKVARLSRAVTEVIRRVAIVENEGTAAAPPTAVSDRR